MPSRTRDKIKISGTVPEIPGQFEPMPIQCDEVVCAIHAFIYEQFVVYLWTDRSICFRL